VRYLGHLARRFFGSLRARRPGPSDQAYVAGHLSEAERDIFWTQPVPDLAHAIRGARRADPEGDRPDLARAALLHDIGKRHASLGSVGRSVATVMSWMPLPMPSKMSTYLDHAALGAAELERLNCEQLVVAFARHHHGECPIGIDPDDWTALVGADDE
jgi:putative nucleotidyltransferase with HDIG domain